MAALHRSVATLRVVGDDLDPSEVSALLGHAPTKSYRKEDATAAQRVERAMASRYSSWHLEATPTEPENLEAQVTEIVGKLTRDLSVWSSLAARYKVDLFCGWFMSKSNEGVDLSPQALAALSSRSIALAIDIYAPECDA